MSASAVLDLDELKRDSNIVSLFMDYVPTLHPSSTGFMGRCPNTNHRDANPSWSLFQDSDGTWLGKCKSKCRNDPAVNIYQLIMQKDGCTFVEAKQKVAAFLGKGENRDVVAEAKPERPAYKYNKAATKARLSRAEAYLTSHGVSTDVARAHDVGVDNYPGVGLCITFPYDETNVKLRALRKKQFLHYKDTSTAGLFYNFASIEQTNRVFITESERDCLTMVSHGFPAISISSATGCVNRDGSLKFTPEDLEKLREKEIFLALDQDEPGRECAVLFQAAIPHAKILTWGDVKDIGELYQQDPANFKEKILLLCEQAPTLEIETEVGDAPPIETETVIDPADVEAYEALSTGFPLTDAGNGERLVAEHGNNIRYLNDDREWRIWDGIRWKSDRTSEIDRLAKGTIRKIMAEASATDDYKNREGLAKWSLSCESRSRLENMVVQASKELLVSTNSNIFDQSPWLFNCANGTIDLENNNFRPARRDDLLSKRSPILYDPKAICPRFESFLAEIIPSLDTRRFLQASLGYTLSGHAWEKIMWFLIGEKGDNGKTTLIETIRYVFGEEDYASNMNFNSLLHREGQGPSGDLARLRGVRFVSACESDQGQKLSSSILKRLTGADKITAAFKYRDEAEFTPSLKLWLATNFPPQLASDDDALWRRIARVPFNISVPLEQQDEQLQDKLKLEGPGILNWMFDGWKRYRIEGLKLPDEVRGATELYREDSDVVKDFLKDRVESDGGDIGSAKLYQAFKAWFAETHNQRQQPMSQKMFSTRLEKLGHPIQKKREGNYVRGIGRLVGDLPSQEDDPFLEFESVEHVEDVSKIP